MTISTVIRPPLADAVERQAEVDRLKSRLGVEPVARVSIGPQCIRTGPDPEASDVAVDVEEDCDQRRDGGEPVEAGHWTLTFRSAAICSMVLVVPARTAFFPVKVCQRVTITST